MSSPFRCSVGAYVFLLVLLTMAKVFLILCFINRLNQTTNLRTSGEMQSRVREIFNRTGKEKYRDEIWNYWHKDRFMNYRLFLSSFETPHTDQILQKLNRSEGLQYVLCVFSSPSNAERRLEARKTWANLSLIPGQNTTLWFFLGQSESIEERRKVLKEREQFGDVIIGNFTDGKRNNTLKLLFSLYFVITSYPSVEEIYFGFDSTYVHLQHLLKKFQFREKTGIGQWRGYVINGMKPERDKASPFYVSEGTFNNSVYPTFCTLQNGFTLSSSLGKQALFKARNETLFVFPDVFLGMLAPKLNLEIVPDMSFGSQVYQPDKQPCKVRSTMTTFTFLGDPVSSWKSVTNVTEMRKCYIPDVDTVLPPMTNNKAYFNKIFKYINNNVTMCSNFTRSSGNTTFIVALITSSVGNFEQRLAIRETWALRHLYYGRIVRHAFVLGKPTTKETETQAKVNEESRKYGDIIQGNFDDSFHNLTVKVVMLLKWVSEYCPGAAYLYKGDDDMFVAWSRLVFFLLQESDRRGIFAMTRLYMGHLRLGSIRVNDLKDKYYVNESVYYGDFYPLYCSGGSYILSTDIIPEIYRRSLVTPLIPIDDAYLGFLTEQIGVSPLNNNGFKLEYYDIKKCLLQDPETHTIHGFKTSKSLKKAWSRYIDGKCLHDP